MNKTKTYPFAFAPGVIQRYPRRRRWNMALGAIVLTAVAVRLGWLLGGAL